MLAIGVVLLIVGVALCLRPSLRELGYIVALGGVVIIVVGTLTGEVTWPSR